MAGHPSDVLTAQHKTSIFKSICEAAMHFQSFTFAPSVHDDINSVRNEVHRAIGPDEHVADRIGIGTFQPNDEKNQDSAKGPRFGVNTSILTQIALISGFRSILRALFGEILSSERLLRAMFRPFGAGPPP
jgi:hypothetical protein